MNHDNEHRYHPHKTTPTSADKRSGPSKAITDPARPSSPETVNAGLGSGRIWQEYLGKQLSVVIGARSFRKIFNVSKILVPPYEPFVNFKMFKINEMNTHSINDVIHFLTIADVKINTFKARDKIDPVWWIP